MQVRIKTIPPPPSPVSEGFFIPIIWWLGTNGVLFVNFEPLFACMSRKIH